MRTWPRLLIAVVCMAGGATVASAQAGSRLIDATKRGDAAAVRSLLSQRADVKATEADGFTALHWAAQRNNLQIVNMLLAAGASAKAANRYQVTPLYLAAVNGST